MHRREVLALPFVLAVPGCVTASLELPLMSAERIKSVVIVTSFTDTVHLKYLPWFSNMIFVNTDDQFVKTNWGVDNHVRVLLAERFKGKCEIKTVNYNPADLAHVEKHEPTSRTVERLKMIVPAGLADAIIFVDGSGQPFDKLNREEKKVARIGTGLLAAPDNTVFAFAQSFVRIFDGRTFETLAYRAGAVSPSGLDVPVPIERLPVRYTGGGWAQLSEEQRTQLRDAAFRLLDKTVTFTFGPNLDGVDRQGDGVSTAAAAEFAKLQVRDAKRWNAVMARLGLTAAS